MDSTALAVPRRSARDRHPPRSSVCVLPSRRRGCGECGQPHRLSKCLWATASVVQGEGGQAVGGRRFGGRPRAVHALRRARHCPQPARSATATTPSAAGSEAATHLVRRASEARATVVRQGRARHRKSSLNSTSCCLKIVDTFRARVSETTTRSAVPVDRHAALLIPSRGQAQRASCAGRFLVDWTPSTGEEDR